MKEKWRNYYNLERNNIAGGNRSRRRNKNKPYLTLKGGIVVEHSINKNTIRIKALILS